MFASPSGVFSTLKNEELFKSLKIGLAILITVKEKFVLTFIFESAGFYV